MVDTKARKFNIDEITFDYMKIAVPDKPDELIHSPIWDSLGHSGISCNDKSDSGYKLDENNMHRFINYRCNYIVIKAINDSVIDRPLGY